MLYSNKIKSYKFVNPNLIYVPRSGMASAVKGEDGDRKSLTGISLSSKRTLLGLNRLGASLYSLGETQRQIRDAVGKQVSVVKDKQKFNLKRKQYLRDQESERQTELAGQVDAKDAIDEKEVKKEGKNKLSWLEKLLGPFKGIVEFALRAIITQGILKWVSDPKNGERLGKVIKGLSAFFGFVFGIVSWSVGTFLSGVSNVFGDGSKGGFSRFAEVLGGLGQILVGLAGLKAAMYLLNPFSLISDILGLIDVISSKGPSGGDVPQGGGSGTPKPQLNKAAQKVAENYGDDAAKLYADSISRGRSPAAALGDVKKRFTKLPPKPTGLLGKMRQGVMDQVGKVRSGVSDTISGVKQFGAKAFDVGKQVFDKGKDLVKGTGSWIKTQAGNVKNLASIAKDPAALGEFVKNIVSNKLKPTLEKNELVKRLLDLVKDPKNIGKNIGPLIKDAIKSKEVLKLRDYLKQVQGKAKIGGLDTVIAALMGLLDYGVFGTPFANAFLAALGGLLGYAGGFALGAPFGGFPGFIAGAAGGIAGEHIGRSLARLLGKGPLGEIDDPLMKDGRKLASGDPALAEGGLITKPTRALIGERGPEIVIPLAMLGGAGGIGPIASMLSSALTGALSAMGSSGELAKQVIGEELSLLKKEGGPSSPANPGETLGKSVVKSSSNLDLLQLGDNTEEFNNYIGDRSSYRKGSDRNTLRGALANILAVFESISKKSFRTSGGGSGTGGAASAGGSAGGSSNVTLEPGKWNPLLDLILKYEAGSAGLESMYPSTRLPGATKMTIAEVASRATGAVGAWQNLPEYLVDRAKAVGLNPQKDLYNAANQQKIAEYLIGPGQGGVSIEMAKNNPKQAMLRLSKVWAAIPKDDSGISYYAGVGNNKAHIKPNQVYEAFQKLSVGGQVESTGEGRTKGSDTKGSPSNHAYLNKLDDENIKKAHAPVGMCVTGSLNTMQNSGVPNPAATGNDVGNNPRGAAVQLIRSFGWQSIGGSNTSLKSPYGTVTTGVFNKSEYAKAVDAGKIPSGALIFQTRHPDWNGTSPSSRGFDMAIAQRKGRSLWNGQSLGQWVYGNTKHVIALTPGGKAADGSAPPDSSTGSTTGDTGTEDKEMTPEEQFQSLMSKLTSDILKLGGGSSEEKAETPVATATPTIQAVPDSNDSSKVPPAPKNVSISAPAPSPQNNLDKLSSIAAELEEDSNQRTALVPVPMSINSSSASSSTPPRKVVRARKPITYGF